MLGAAPGTGLKPSPGHCAPSIYWVLGNDPDKPHARPAEALLAQVVPFPGPGHSSGFITLQVGHTPWLSFHKLARPPQQPCTLQQLHVEGEAQTTPILSMGKLRPGVSPGLANSNQSFLALSGPALLTDSCSNTRTPGGGGGGTLSGMKCC